MADRESDDLPGHLEERADDIPNHAGSSPRPSVHADVVERFLDEPPPEAAAVLDKIVRSLRSGAAATRLRSVPATDEPPTDTLNAADTDVRCSGSDALSTGAAMTAAERPRRRRAALRATRLDGPVPLTRLDPLLIEVCRSGERAVTVFARAGDDPCACLGSPADPESFLVWRASGITVFLAGEVPASLELSFDYGARVVATVR